MAEGYANKDGGMNMSEEEKARVSNYGLKELGWDKVPLDIVDKSLKDLVDMKGKTAIVTGAGGDGLGFAISNRLAALGCTVVMTDISDRVFQNAKAVAEKWNAKTYPLICDIMKFDDIKNMFEEANKLLGGHIDILVNNANYTLAGPFQKATEQEIRTCVDGPYTSAVYACRLICDYMIPQKHGKIINIVSEAAVRSNNVDLSIYAASKAGVIGLTKSLAGELAPFGIIVNAVAPGVMLNPYLREIFKVGAPETLGVRKSMVDSTKDCLMKRVSIAEEVANTVAFLASDAASFIDGQIIMNGGGMTV
ncbi:MAG: SDR family NAD(P)-dependent oxidoreductase [Bacilli bacterium]